MEINRSKEGVLYWTDYIDGKRIKRESKYWKTRREAKAHYDMFIENLEDMQIEDPTTFHDVAMMYLDFTSVKNKMSSQVKNRYTYNNHLKKFFKHKLIRNITVADIERYQIQLVKKTYRKLMGKDENGTKIYEEKHYSNTTLKKIQVQLGLILEYAYNHSFISTNIWAQCLIAKRVGVKEPKKAQVLLTKSDFEAFIGTIEDQTYITLYSLLYWSGMRIGEALGLYISDYNYETKSILIQNNWDFTNQVLTTTKSENERTVSLPDVAAKELEKLILKYREISKITDPFIFGYYKPLSGTTINRHRRELISDANLKLSKDGIAIPYFSFHDLRHTHVSTLIELGLSPKDISDRLGHSVEMVNNTYGHLFPQRKQTILDKLNEIA